MPHLHQAAYWFYLTSDRERLKRAIALTDNVFTTVNWGSGDAGKKLYAKAVAFANSQADPRKPSRLK